MIPGLTTSASGLLAEERLQQLLSNNLANVQTPGFKSSSGSFLSFPEELLQRVNYGSATGTSIGTLGTGVTLQEGVPMFMQGVLNTTNNGLAVAIVDTGPSGPYAAVASAVTGQPASVAGQVAVGAGGRLEVGGRPIAVLDSTGKVVAGMTAIRNPAYQGGVLFAGDGLPNYDSAGNPSYYLANAQGKQVGIPGEGVWAGGGIRIGTSEDMGNHSFYAVAYQSPYASGIALTRNGEFQVNGNQELVDASGNAVLPVGSNGKPLANARIRVNSAYAGTAMFQADGSPVIGKNGQPSYTVVDTAGNPVAGARLGTVDADVTQLSPLGQTEYQLNGSLNPTQVLAQLQPGTGQMKPGAIEQSTVDATSTITQMAAVMSLYQANANVLQVQATTVGQAVTDVGKVNG